MTVFQACKSMMYCASAESAEASFSCADSASNSFVALILDAILASIIICGLLGLVSALVIVIALLVLVELNLLVFGNLNAPGMRMHA